MELLGAGCEAGATDDNLQTPLHLAAGSGAAEVVQYLLSRGVGVKARDKNGKTPLQVRFHSKAVSGRRLPTSIDAVRL